MVLLVKKENPGRLAIPEEDVPQYPAAVMAEGVAKGKVGRPVAGDLSSEAPSGARVTDIPIQPQGAGQYGQVAAVETSDMELGSLL